MQTVKKSSFQKTEYLKYLKYSVYLLRMQLYKIEERVLGVRWFLISYLNEKFKNKANSPKPNLINNHLV